MQIPSFLLPNPILRLPFLPRPLRYTERQTPRLIVLHKKLTVQQGLCNTICDDRNLQWCRGFFGGIQLRGTVPGLDSMESWFASLFPPPDVTRRTAHLRSLFLLPLFNGVDGSNVTTRAKASATKGGRSPKKLFSEQTGCSYHTTLQSKRAQRRFFSQGFRY